MPGFLQLSTTNSERHYPEIARDSQGNALTENFLFQGKNREDAILPSVTIHDERAEICVILEVDFADDVRNLVPQWSAQGLLGDDQYVNIGFIVGVTAGN